MPILKIPRNLMFTNASAVELVGFCDASKIAYGCVLYIRAIFPDKIHSNLICSKSRIVPIDNKRLTVPRLELNAALVLAGLVEKLFTLLKTKVNKVFLYSDSNIVLAWLATDPLRLNPCVANRVIKIQRATSNFKWLYINTKENPADCSSRGLDPQEIESNHLWFHGPSMLCNKNFCHSVSLIEIPNPLPEEKISVNVLHTKLDTFFFLH